jgi:tetratricopeptide (TPR) repeat protein
VVEEPILLYRGELLLALGKPEEATAELTKSLAASRVLIDSHGVLTKSMLVRGNTFLALGRAWAAAGKPDEAQGHWKDAAKVFELALRIDKDNFHHFRGLAEAQKLVIHPRKEDREAVLTERPRDWERHRMGWTVGLALPGLSRWP